MKVSKIIALIILLAFIMGGITSWSFFRKTDIVEFLPLPYTKSDLEYIGKGECIVDMKKLASDEGMPMIVNIRKWEGEDIVIAIPNIMLHKAFLGESYIIDKDNVIRLDFEDCSPTDLYLLQDKIVVAMNGIYEYNYNTEQMYGIEITDLSHRIELLDNGNFVIVRSVLNQAMEINKNGEVIWEWNALRDLKDYKSDTYIGYELIVEYEKVTNPLALYRQQYENQIEWTHINTIQKLEDGYLLNFRNLDTIVKVNQFGNIIWSFGGAVIKHAHDAHILDNGNLLIYDNGNGRAIEINPANGDIIWEFDGLLAPAMGSVEKLWNDNYLVTDCYHGTVYEVTPDNEILKEIRIETAWIPWARAFNPSEIQNFK